jgi:peptidoglycan/LPS O-acetylase OafA/YrhL
VLSGFLVGGLLVKEWRLRGRIDAKQFLIRRGFKIWPQYYSFLLLMVLVGHRGLSKLWGNFLNIQNYTGSVPHTWTLAVEEHAYLLLTGGMALAAIRGMRVRTMFVLLVVASAAVIALRFLLAAHGYVTFFRTDTRIDGIFYGVMLAIIYHYRPEMFSRLQSWRWRWLWLLVVVFALAYFGFIFHGFWAGPLSWMLADGMGIALLMLLYRHREGKKRWLIYRVIAWIGLYSYGIYLWHVSVIAPMRAFARHLPFRLQTPWEVLIPLAGILVGALTTKVIEFPSLKLRDRLYPRRVDSAVGIPAEVEKKALDAPSSEAISGLRAAS